MSGDSELSDELQRVLAEFGPSLQPLSPEEAVQKFIAKEKSELAPMTLSEYETELGRLVEFCDRNSVEDTSEFDGRMLHDYKIWRRDTANDVEGSLSNKTMRDEMYLLRKFLRFLESIDAVTPRLHEKIEIPTLKPGEGVRDIEFDSDEVDSILNYLETLFGSTLLISEDSVNCMFECVVTWLSVEFSSELKGSEIRRQLVF